jgi:hypothetical protein
MSTPVVPPAPPTYSKTIFGMSKSSVQSDLTVAVVVMLLLSQYQLPAIATTAETHAWIWITWGAALLAAILKSILARYQGDATS